MTSVPKFQATSYEFCEYIDADNYIGGQWVKPSLEQRLEILNPRHGRVMATVGMSDMSDVEAAVNAAKAALPAWRSLPMRDRGAVLYKLRELMLRDLEELTWLVSHENGKIYSEAQAEVLKAVECAEYGCALPNLAAGGQLDVSRGVNCQVTYEPLGIVAGITPFNFPAMVPMWMMPQALVGGNAFILKPSERVPLSSLKLAALLKEAGLPDGIFSIVQGGKQAVEALCDHPEIRALAFVGSTPVAKLVYARAAASGKSAVCLGGAKNHLIVVPDADLELTAENVMASFAGCAGQRCMAASVLVAVGDVDHIIEGIAAKARALKIGDGLGPVTTAAARDRIIGYIDQAEKQGATILVDGRQDAADEGGFWVGPTILDHVTPDMPASCDEIFGPVLSIVRVKNIEEAIRLENSSPYGNASSIYTTSGDIARKVIERVSAGMCGVNIGVPVPREPFGFGGWNDSKFGQGDITGWDGFRFWTQPRKVTTKWALQKDATWMS